MLKPGTHGPTAVRVRRLHCMVWYE